MGNKRKIVVVAGLFLPLKSAVRTGLTLRDNNTY